MSIGRAVWNVIMGLDDPKDDPPEYDEDEERKERKSLFPPRMFHATAPLSISSIAGGRIA
jgi:hypothetical protein